MTKFLPDSERFGLISQIHRAVISVRSNLAEGSGRATLNDQKHFFRLAYSSLLEILNQLILASDLEHIGKEELGSCRSQIEQCTRLTAALYSSRGH